VPRLCGQCLLKERLGLYVPPLQDTDLRESDECLGVVRLHVQRLRGEIGRDGEPARITLLAGLLYQAPQLRGQFQITPLLQFRAARGVGE